MEATQVHPFERAGLGKAPYRFVGHQVLKFQAVAGAPDCPVQAGGSCDFCAMAICDAYFFESADGRVFKTGCDCFFKAESNKLLVAKVKSEKSKLDAKKRAARKAVKAALVVASSADLIRELELTAESGSGFARQFAMSLATQVRNGKAPSEKQAALWDRIKAEQGEHVR